MGEAAGVAHGLAGIGHEGLSVFTEVLVPLAAGVAGFFGNTAVGGTNSVSYLIWTAGGPIFKANGNNAARIAAAIMAGIKASIGYAFWGIRKRGGMVMHLLGGGIGGFFLGAALGEVPTLISGASPPRGALDTLFAWTQNAATGKG
jgi:hypothetical protein